MSTLWWLVVLVLVAMVAFSTGFVVRAQMEVWNRMQLYIDFHRDRLGA